MNPYAILGAALLWGASLLGTGWWFYGSGRDSEKAKQADIDKAIQKTRDAAQQGAADAIVKAAADNTKTITRIKTVTREVPVYRSTECQHDDRVWDDLNSALRGEPAGQGLVPKGSGGADGQGLRDDLGKAR